MARLLSRLVGWADSVATRRRMDSTIDIWAKTEFGKNAGWAKEYYLRTGRFPSGKDVR